MARDPLANPAPLIRRVYSYVAYRIGDGPDAQDVTSETFERALRGKGTYDRSKGSPEAWLIGIARRCVADAMAARLPTVADPPDIAGRTDVEEESIRHLTLSAAIALLDVREQDLVALRYGGDLTAKRIGEILGMQTNAVEVALHRALARLRTLLEEEVTPTAATEAPAASEALAADL